MYTAYYIQYTSYYIPTIGDPGQDWEHWTSKSLGRADVDRAVHGSTRLGPLEVVLELAADHIIPRFQNARCQRGVGNAVEDS